MNSLQTHFDAPLDPPHAAQLKRISLWVCLLITQGLMVHADDWTHYRGPNHDGKSAERISKQWPSEGPRQAWKAPTPNGFSSFAVADGKAFTLVGRPVEGVDREVLIALDTSSGKELWSQILGVAKYGHGGGDDGTRDNRGGDGPRSTPTVDGNRVYAMNADLVLTCHETSTGKVVWSRDLMREHGGKNITWKNAASPVIEGDLIFVAGGGAGQALLGLHKKNGEVVWKGQDDAMTHATPVPATIHGVRQVIFLTQTGLISVKPSDGTVLWRHAFPFSVSTAASPVVGGDIVYCSAGYGVGAAAFRITREGQALAASEIWRKPGNTLANHWSTPVFKDGYLYGMFGFKDYGKGPMKCVELATGEEIWSKEGFGPGNLILVDNHLLALSDTGELVLVEATPKSYVEVARADVLDGKCWSTPVVSNGRVYVRSTKEAVCLDVGSRTASR